MRWFENFFSSTSTKNLNPEYSATMEKIEDLLSDIPEPEARLLACMALLAARIANIDDNITVGERQRMHAIFCERLKLTEAKAKIVLDIAIASELAITIEHHIVTRRLNELTSREQKLDLLRMLFYIAAENDITEQEAEVVGNVANSLMLPRSDFLAIQAEYREHRKIFKDLPAKMKNV